MLALKNTSSVFIVCLKVLLRAKKFTFFFLFLVLCPLYIIINYLFLILDNLFFHRYRKQKIKKPIFIMGFNRSGTTFFHHLLSRSQQFTTSSTWNFIVPSISLRKLIWVIRPLLKFFKFDKLERKKRGHRVGLDDIEEDEMLFFLHRLDSLWLSNHLIPWMKFDRKYKPFTQTLYIDSEQNNANNYNSIVFLKDFWKRQSYLNNEKQILSKSNPFIFRINTIKKVFPDAKIIFIVRDPAETIASFFSMQERMKFGNKLNTQELKLYRAEAYQEIINWYKETEKAKDFLNENDYLVLKYEELVSSLYASVEKTFEFINDDMSKEFKEMVSKKSSLKYRKKHQNKTIDDFGFTKKQIKDDFDFVYDEYFS